MENPIKSTLASLPYLFWLNKGKYVLAWLNMWAHIDLTSFFALMALSSLIQMYPNLTCLLILIKLLNLFSLYMCKSMYFKRLRLMVTIQMVTGILKYKVWSFDFFNKQSVSSNQINNIILKLTSITSVICV